VPSALHDPIAFGDTHVSPAPSVIPRLDETRPAWIRSCPVVSTSALISHDPLHASWTPYATTPSTARNGEYECPVIP